MLGSTSTDSVMEDLPIPSEAMEKHNELSIALNGLVTDDSLANIKRMARTYLDLKTVHKAKDMDQLFTALEVKRVIGVGKYDKLIGIMRAAGVIIGIEVIQKTAKDIKAIMQNHTPSQEQSETSHLDPHTSSQVSTHPSPEIGSRKRRQEPDDPRQLRSKTSKIESEPVRAPPLHTDRDQHPTQETNRPMLFEDIMDDPDLTQGPVNVKVENCTPQFYIDNHKESYPMTRIPKGKALIINVNKVTGEKPRQGTDIDRDNLDKLFQQLGFKTVVYNDKDGLKANSYPMTRIPKGKALIINVNEVTGEKPRQGTDIDRDNLDKLFQQLGFKTVVYNDKDGLKANDIDTKLREFAAMPDHKVADACVICLLSHGKEGIIYGTDGKTINLDTVFSYFDNQNCKYLQGKPKLFIIQACRGGALDKGVICSSSGHDEPDQMKAPSRSDMLICFPTQQGYYAWRNRSLGSWYVEALVRVFMEYAKCEDVYTMLNRVNMVVSRKVSHCEDIRMDQACQMSEHTSTLRMPHFYFFPGINSPSK